MRKLLFLATIPAMLITTAAFGQGTIDVKNTLQTIVVVSNSTTHTTSFGGTSNGATAELLYQPGGGSAPAPIVNGNTATLGAWEATGPYFDSSPNPFTLTGNFGRFAEGTQETGTDVAPGGNAWFTVIGWTGGYADVQTAIDNGAAIGESTTFELTSGNPNFIPGGTLVELTASTAGTGFVAGTPFAGLLLISPVPEPSTVAIGMLGAVALLFFRRRTPMLSRDPL